jgi:hypothetical protein
MQIKTCDLKAVEKQLDVTEDNLLILIRNCDSALTGEKLEHERNTSVTDFRRFLHQATDQLHQFRRSVRQELRSRELGS